MNIEVHECNDLIKTTSSVCFISCVSSKPPDGGMGARISNWMVSSMDPGRTCLDHHSISFNLERDKKKKRTPDMFGPDRRTPRSLFRGCLVPAWVSHATAWRQWRRHGRGGENAPHARHNSPHSASR
jgi:hypothetical protein